MANLTSTGVTILRSWCEGATNGRRVSCIKASLTLVAMGTVANAIPASAFGLGLIEQSSQAVLSDNSKSYPTVPSADETQLLIMDPAQATDANRANPADITGTLIVTVKGFV